MPGEPVPGGVAGLRAASARLRELLTERDAEIAALRAGREADRELARRARQQSGRERRKDRRPGGQPGHQGKGLQRDPGGRETADPAAAGSPHVMIVRTPDERLMFLQAMSSRRKDAIAGALPGPFADTLIAGDYAAYQHLLAQRGRRHPRRHRGKALAAATAGNQLLSLKERCRARLAVRSSGANERHSSGLG